MAVFCVGCLETAPKAVVKGFPGGVGRGHFRDATPRIPAEGFVVLRDDLPDWIVGGLDHFLVDEFKDDFPESINFLGEDCWGRGADLLLERVVFVAC